MRHISEEEQARIVDEINKAHEEYLRKHPEKQDDKTGKDNKGDQIPSSPIIHPTSIIQSDYWLLERVEYRGNVKPYGLMKTLLDNGNSKTQDEWAEYSISAIKNNTPFTPDYPLFYGIVKAAKSQGLEDARQFLQKQAREENLVILTRLKYQPKGKEIIAHNYKMDDQYQLKGDFVGPDGNIKDTPSEIYKALLGTDNVQEIDDVFRWLNGTDVWIWRVNKKPEILDERVARFFAGSGGSLLYCDRYPGCRDASLGVFPCAEGARQKI